MKGIRNITENDIRKGARNEKGGKREKGKEIPECRQKGKEGNEGTDGARPAKEPEDRARASRETDESRFRQVNLRLGTIQCTHHLTAVVDRKENATCGTSLSFHGSWTILLLKLATYLLCHRHERTGGYEPIGDVTFKGNGKDRALIPIPLQRKQIQSKLT
jgi:hypothetical protein